MLEPQQRDRVVHLSLARRRRSRRAGRTPGCVVPTGGRTGSLPGTRSRVRAGAAARTRRAPTCQHAPLTVRHQRAAGSSPATQRSKVVCPSRNGRTARRCRAPADSGEHRGQSPDRPPRKRMRMPVSAASSRIASVAQHHSILQYVVLDRRGPSAMHAGSTTRHTRVHPPLVSSSSSGSLVQGFGEAQFRLRRQEDATPSAGRRARASGDGRARRVMPAPPRACGRAGPRPAACGPRSRRRRHRPPRPPSPVSRHGYAGVDQLACQHAYRLDQQHQQHLVELRALALVPPSAQTPCRAPAGAGAGWRGSHRSLRRRTPASSPCPSGRHRPMSPLNRPRR